MKKIDEFVGSRIKRAGIEKIELSQKELQFKINEIRGDFNEYLARKYYEKLGYKLIKLVITNKTSNGVWEHIINKNEIEYIFNLMLGNGIVCKRLKKRLLKHQTQGLPDFFCVNQKNYKDFFFLECKADEKNIRPEQMDEFDNLLSSNNCKIKLFITKVKLGLDYDDTFIKLYK
jgi:hypothetical protein